MVSTKTSKGEFIFLDKRENGKFELITNCGSLISLVNKQGKQLILKDKKKWGEAAGVKAKVFILTAKEWRKIAGEYDKKFQ